MIYPPPDELPALGPIFVGGDTCSYFRDGRPARTAYAQPFRQISDANYDKALSLGMRRSGELLYRPICPGCRKCQPFRVDTQRFEPSKSQRRVIRKCEGQFEIRMHNPRVDPEHIELFAKYQQMQHQGRGIEPSETSYRGFLGESAIPGTRELSWRDAQGKLRAVGIIDLVPSGLSTVYFFWDPDLRDLSLGTYSALAEIDLCRQWDRRYYYLGYLVPGAETMNYKASFDAGEVWDGENWLPLPARGLEDPGVIEVLQKAEVASMRADAARFPNP